MFKNLKATAWREPPPALGGSSRQLGPVPAGESHPLASSVVREDPPSVNAVNARVPSRQPGPVPAGERTPLTQGGALARRDRSQPARGIPSVIFNRSFKLWAVAV